ncbi:MAG: hypothetical protein I8H96_03490, partial [Sphingomonadaceae bacterium]|nr:hypothetical protein [Sphingomonadaceae bacterium]
MSKLSSFVALTLVAIGGISPAMAKDEADPAVYLAAFNDTCRRGFPDLDKIAAHAQSIGWVVSEVRRTDGVADIFSDGASPFRVFHKDGLMLFLTAMPGGPYKAVCQISGGGTGTKAQSADIAALMTPSLKAGDPTFSTEGGNDMAIWQVAPGITVAGGINIYRK